MKRVLMVIVLTLPVLSTSLPASAVIATVGTPALATGDFDGNGVSDLAVGVAREDVGLVLDAGAVNIIYGKGNGLSAQDDQIWHQDSVDIADTAEDGDQFGNAVEAGDFNGDGFDDLAVGVPYENTAGEFDAGANSGAVNVIYGSASGLTAQDDQIWTQVSAGLDASESGDQFGGSLAAANFGKGGRDDLAVGASGETIAAASLAGAVGVLFGAGPGGLDDTDSKFLHQSVAGVPGDPEQSDRLGWSVASGNFGKSNHADLAVGIINETVDQTYAGAVNVFYGSTNGIKTTGSQLWHEDVPDIKGEVSNSTFGWALAAGNFGKGPLDDLAIGAPTETVGGQTLAGAVHVIYGSSSGLRSQGNQMWHEGSPGILDVPAPSEVFGSRLAVGGFGKSGQDDLAVSAPRTDNSAGRVHVIYGANNGLTSAGDQVWHQDVPGIADQSESSDYFGAAMTAGDFGKNARSDLAIGAGPEDVGTVTDAGAVNVLYGSAQGVRTEGDQFWHQDVPGIQDEAEQSDYFGGQI